MAKAGRYLVLKTLHHAEQGILRPGTEVDLSEKDATLAMRSGSIVEAGKENLDPFDGRDTPLSMAEFAAIQRAAFEKQLPLMHHRYVQEWNKAHPDKAAVLVKPSRIPQPSPTTGTATPAATGNGNGGNRPAPKTKADDGGKTDGDTTKIDGGGRGEGGRGGGEGGGQR